MSYDVARQLQTLQKEECIQEEYGDIENEQKLLQIEVPVISIFTIGENCGQLQTEIFARKYFTNKGYSVMQIGSHDFMRLVGCLSVPEVVLDPTIDPLKKAIVFNRFVYKQSKLRKPDIILLGVPHPIMKYNNRNLNRLGFLPMIIQNSIKSDIGIVNMYFGSYRDKFYEEIKQLCRYKLDVDTRYFGIANTIIT